MSTPDVTVVVDTPDEPPPPVVVVEEAPPSATTAPEVAAAVGEGVAAGTAAVAAVMVEAQQVAAQTAEQQFVTADELAAMLDARLAPLINPTPAVVEAEVVLEDDEVVPSYRHPWFKPFSELRGEK